MSPAILSDPRVRSIPWRDLVRPTPLQVAWELSISLPWLAAALGLAAAGWWPFALGASFFFYLTGLRQVHNAFHHTIGVSRPVDAALLFLHSVLMLGSMHAIKVNHLHHHRHCLDDDDLEGASARMKPWQALLGGLLIQIRIHAAAWSLARSADRRWIVAELAVNVVWVGLVFAIIGWWPLQFFVIAMFVGQWLSPFFCVWTVHHDCDRSHFNARTIRNRFRALTTYEMFYHLEHHLFPAVPTCNLPRLAERLDAAAPELQSRRAW